MTLGTCCYENSVKLPAIKKRTKPETIKKLINRLLFDVYNDSAVGILNSLIEKNSFRMETVPVIENEFKGFKAVLHIDGKVFESVHSAKKKANNAVCKIALHYLFSDVIQQIKTVPNSDNFDAKHQFDDNFKETYDCNTSVVRKPTTSSNLIPTCNAILPTAFNCPLLQSMNDDVLPSSKMSNRSMETIYSDIPTALRNSTLSQESDNPLQLFKINHLISSNNVDIAMKFNSSVLQQKSDIIFESSKPSDHSIMSNNATISISQQTNFNGVVPLKTSNSVQTNDARVPITCNSSILQLNCENIIQSKTKNQSSWSSDWPYPSSQITSVLDVRNKSGRVNVNSESISCTSDIKKMRKESENVIQCSQEARKKLQNPESKCEITSCRPPLQKGLKDSSVKRIVEQALELYDNQNPNTVTALFSLFSRDTFSFDIVPYGIGEAKFKVTLIIGGNMYTCVESSMKKGKKNVTKMALRDFFPEYAGLTNHSEISAKSCKEIPNVHEHLQGKVYADENTFDLVNAVSAFKFPDNSSAPMENGNEISSFYSCELSDSAANELSLTAVPSFILPQNKSIKNHTEVPNFCKLTPEIAAVNECNSNIVQVVPKCTFRQNSAMSIENPEVMLDVNEHSHGDAITDESSLVPVNEIPEFKVPTNTHFFCFADYIANLVQRKYDEVMSKELEFRKRYSVLSGVVMIENNDISTGTVICVSTGNKCILGDNISKVGDVLFDCHAEILARRCLISFLYSQLYTALTTTYNTILEMTPKREFRVKDNVRFYLYISSAPCGDGRVFNFSPVQNPDRKQADKRGILRVKLETGMGGIPTNEYYNKVSSYEEYLKGFPLVLMCCSEKLMVCNVVGIQGALLSHFLEPVYFNGIIIGDIFHKNNLERALFKRATIVSSELQPPYRLNEPFIVGITNSKMAINVKPGRACMNWMIHESASEFIQIRIGKTVSGEPSRICKRNLFRKFIRVLTIFRKANNLPNLTSASYLKCKEDSITYQQVKNLLLTSLDENGRGKWIKTPKEVDSFSFDIIHENTGTAGIKNSRLFVIS